MMLVFCVMSVILAAAWPFIYPGLDYVMALIGFGSSPGLFSAIREFGPIYGKLSPTAPAFFKGMAQASQQLGGEHPALASLPYMVKASVLMSVSIPLYVVELLVLVAVGFISFLSRLLPWEKVKTAVQVTAIVVSLLPLLAILLWCVLFIGIAYVQAWFASLLDFLFLIILFPAVVIKVVTPWIGVLVVARYLVPSGLVLAGEGSRATKAYESILEG